MYSYCCERWDIIFNHATIHKYFKLFHFKYNIVNYISILLIYMVDKWFFFLNKNITRFNVSKKKKSRFNNSCMKNTYKKMLEWVYLNLFVENVHSYFNKISNFF